MSANTISHRVYDTFNRRVISNHRSIKAAVIAASTFSRAVRRHNGQGAYIPTRIERLEDGEWLGVPSYEVHDAEQQFLNR